VGDEPVTVLLDTHVLIWSVERPELLGNKARTLLMNEAESLFVSAVTALEIARLSSLGQIRLTGSAGAWFDRAIHSLGAQLIVMDHAIAMDAYQLPSGFHADPADRILAATARLHRLRLLTADQKLLSSRAVNTINANK
jgi:PIN domain nuclease of toxin-antitoxin system